jgi:AraC-like DNA-binding protein
MTRLKFPWRDEYAFVEPGITADAVRVYPFERAFPLDIKFLISSGRHHVRMNRHEFFEIAHIYEGSAEIRILSRYLKLQKGDTVVIGSDIYHQFVAVPGQRLRLVSLNFHPDIVRNNDSTADAERYLSPFIDQGEDFSHVILSQDPLSAEVFRWMLKIHAELPADTTFKQLAVRTYLRVLLLMILRHYAGDLSLRDRVARKERDLQRLRPLFDLIDVHYGKELEITDAARACAMSSSHFMRFFKATTGQPFRAYLTAFRVAKAQLLLTETEKSIAEISEETAFCSQSYFGEVFRAALGMTPLAYRRKFRRPLLISEATAATTAPRKHERPAKALASVSRIDQRRRNHR